MKNSVEFRSGSGTTTEIGFTNSSDQRNDGTLGVKGTDHLQVAYRLECLRCGFVYGANGSDIHERKCPECQSGRPGIRYWDSEETSKFDPTTADVVRLAAQLAKTYRALTGKPLGITGEIAEFQAARLLNLTLEKARSPGFDAIEEVAGIRRKLQIKGRCVLQGSSRSQRVGSIHSSKEFDAVLLVLLDEDFEATAIYEAQRNDVLSRLSAPGSKSRNDRGALSVSQFISISTPRWQRPR